MLSGHILCHCVPLTSFHHEALDPPPTIYCVALTLHRGTHLWHRFGTLSLIFESSKRISFVLTHPMYIAGDVVNLLNNVNVQTYFIYVCYIAIFLLADQLKWEAKV